ncbi:hypothetical protein FMO003_01100 [Moritella sp. F3]|nr:hypothetical protein FMO001_33590 [Moritella sp. F1]GIC79829.1 hypothetical protein FMO003_01100 [Moritella sp. F3]
MRSRSIVLGPRLEQETSKAVDVISKVLKPRCNTHIIVILIPTIYDYLQRSSTGWSRTPELSKYCSDLMNLTFRHNNFYLEIDLSLMESIWLNAWALKKTARIKEIWLI